MTPKNSARIAVLIPAYNAQLSIERALASLAANNEPHDIIIVDDGSSPPLREWLAPRQNVKILRMDSNSGITAALNQGLRYILDCGYDYVARMDADDEALPERLAIQRSYLDEHPEIAVLGSCGEVVTEQGVTLFYLNHPTDHESIVRKLRYNNCFLHPSLMLRAQVFREAGLYSELYPSAEDYELLCRLAGRYRMANLPRYLIRYTLAEGGISLRTRKRQLQSRLKVQWRYRDWAKSDFYIGLMQTFILRMIPVGVVLSIKQKRRCFGRVDVKTA